MRRLLISLALLSTLILAGCYMNIFQTAQVLDRGEMLLGFGLGFSVPSFEDLGEIGVLVPQVQIGLGIAEGTQLTLQAGALVIPQGEGGLGLSGIVGELKMRLFDEPGGLAMALGFGGGWGFSYLGWGIHTSLYLSSHNPFFPVYFALRPYLSLGDEGVNASFQAAAGIAMWISPSTTLLLEADYNWGFINLGVGLLTVF